MIKKIFKGIMAMTLALSMTVTVMAAPSIVGALDMGQVSASKGTATVTEVTSGMYAADLQAVVDKLNNAPAASTVKDAFGSSLPKFFDLYNETGLIQENVTLDGYKFLTRVMDLQFSGVTPTMEDKVQVTFVANNMTSNMQVDALHYCEEHGWEILQGEKLAANKVEVDYHSASPVALIYKITGDGTVDTDTNSPQTGEASMIPMIAATFALICFGGYAMMKSRKEA